MKFSTTTSSLLLATMAMSPSLSAAAPTRIEVSTSPNPVGTPNTRQFSASPLFDSSSGSSSKNIHTPAHRTGGSGSPRRSIPSRMLKSRKRQNEGVLGLGPLLDPVTSILKGLPIVGGLLGGSEGKSGEEAQAVTSGVSSLSGSVLKTGLPSTVDPGLGPDSVASLVGGVTGGKVNGLPIPHLSSLPPALDEVLGGGGGSSLSRLGLGLFSPQSTSPSDPKFSFESPVSQSLVPEIIQLPDGRRLVVDKTGIWRELAAAPLNAESIFSPPATGQTPPSGGPIDPPHSSPPTPQITEPGNRPQIAPAAFVHGGVSPQPFPDVFVHPPSPSSAVHPSQLPASASPLDTPVGHVDRQTQLPHAPATNPPPTFQPQATPGDPSANPPVQEPHAAAAVPDLPVHPGAPTATPSPNTSAHLTPSIQAVEFQPAPSVHAPVSSLPTDHALHTSTPASVSTPSVASAASFTDFVGADGSEVDPLPGLIHGMAAP